MDAMRDLLAPKVSKWPFLIGDALLLGLAFFIYARSNTPFGSWEITSYVSCVAIGAWLSSLPFIMDYRAAVRLAESDSLTTAVSQIQNLEQLAAQIGYATSQWQIVREAADKTTHTAQEIANGMAAEVKSFNEFIQRSNEGEKATMRLELEKLRRAELDWLQVIVRILDHVYALHHAASRSRQPGVAEQLAKFQSACHEASRRIGLTPFTAAPDEAFDAKRHQLVDPDSKPAADARIAETLASGYTFQGRLIRPALVNLQTSAVAAPAAEAPAKDQSDLPLDPAEADAG